MNSKPLFAVALTLGILFVHGGVNAADTITAMNLRCEGRVNPLGIESPTPRLGWQIKSGQRNVLQSAWQVLVADSPATLTQDTGTLWDSGKQPSGQSQQIPYAGKALPSASTAYWKVRVWDQEGNASPWSETATWTTGLKPEDWQAQWISEDIEKDTQGLPMFRKEFTAKKPIAKAVAYVCGLGQFEFSLNGSKVGDHFLDPGWTDYEESCLYVPFDVTDQIQQGDNAIGIMLGNGMYNVTGGRYIKFKGSFGAPKLIFQLHLTYEDGHTEIVKSDATWRVSKSPITFNCIYGGEDYDARMEQPGWNTAAFNDAHWAQAKPTTGPGGVLRAQSAPPIKVARVVKPVSIKKLEAGKYEVDLDYNLSAYPFMTVKGPKGSTVTLETAERSGNIWNGHSYTYTLKGDGEETFRPRFTYFSYQYLYVTGADLPEDAAGSRPVLVNIGSDFITSSAKDVGAFQCSNDLFNDINAMIDRSVRSNLQHVLTDCPHREKLGWLEVSHLMAPSIFYHYDVQNLWRKICFDTTESQLESGLVPDIAPEYTRFKDGFFESAEWGSACVQNPWLLYLWYGDQDILRRQYETMVKYTDYLASTRNEQGLAKGGLGDWYDWTPEHGHVGAAQLTPPELPATVMLFDNARIVGTVAAMLGKEDDVAKFNALAAQVKADFLKAYYDAEKKVVSTGSQSAMALGLYFDLVPTDDRPAVLKNLVHEIESMQYRPTTGEVCFRYLVQALAREGRSDVVYKLIDRTDPPGYGCMLKQYGLKTLSERWDKPGSSLNHCMFGHIQEWFQGHILGIQQAHGSTGWKKVRIAPLFMTGLGSAAGHYDSPRGRIAVQWQQNNVLSGLKVTIPGNTTAEVVIPYEDTEYILESGQDLEERGITIVHNDDAVTVVALGSGTYSFTW